MKAIYFVLIFSIFQIQEIAAQTNPLIRGGISFQYRDLSDFKEQQKLFQAIGQYFYHVDPVITESFEKQNSFFADINIGYLWDNPSFFLGYTYFSTGGRTDYGDYSGRIRQDLIFTIQTLEITYSPILYSDGNYINMRSDISYFHSFHNVSENYEFRLFDELSTPKNKIKRQSDGLRLKLGNEIKYSYLVLGVNAGLSLEPKIYYDDRKTDYSDLISNYEINLYMGIDIL